MLRAVILDVNETLLDLAPLGERFLESGLGADLVPLWFSNILRDGFALTVVGEFVPFRQLAVSNLVSLLAAHGSRDGEAAATAMVDAIAGLPLHADVGPGLRALRDVGVTVATMTNGTAAVTEAALRRDDLLDLVDLRLDVQGPLRWKPAPEAYHYAVDRCGAPAAESMLVAVHPWDVYGATKAGLAGGWLNRGRLPWPFDPPTPHEIFELSGAASVVRGIP